MPGSPYQQKGFRLHMLSHAIILRQRSFVTTIGLTSSQARIITYLFTHQENEVCQTDIERFLNVRAASVTGVLANMERDHFILRRSSQRDRRFKIITLTEKGRSVYDSIMSSIYAIDAQITEGMSPAESAAFDALIDRALGNMKE